VVVILEIHAAARWVRGSGQSGVAIQQHLAGIIWFGLVFPIAMVQVIVIVFRLTLPMPAIAVSIETRYKNPHIPGLNKYFVATGGCNICYMRPAGAPPIF
jgi:hypothetical protein